jgi:hypothetical protein
MQSDPGKPFPIQRSQFFEQFELSKRIGFVGLLEAGMSRMRLEAATEADKPGPAIGRACP